MVVELLYKVHRIVCQPMVRVQGKMQPHIDGMAVRMVDKAGKTVGSMEKLREWETGKKKHPDRPQGF